MASGFIILHGRWSISYAYFRLCEGGELRDRFLTRNLKNNQLMGHILSTLTQIPNITERGFGIQETDKTEEATGSETKYKPLIRTYFVMYMFL
ncbi:hypothetical protein LguiB_023284 [Lonicera macranthoides]